MKEVRCALFVIFAATGTLWADGPVPDCGLYLYRAEITRVIDGDTVVANIDLGFNTWRHDEHLRLFGIDTPEKGDPEAAAASAALAERIEGKSLYICTIKSKRSEKEAKAAFERYLVKIFDGGENVNDWLITSGFAVPYIE